MDRSQDWIKQARRDLQRAKLDVEHDYFEWACFAAQQSAEKAVKAVYQASNQSVRGHSIVKMLQGLQNSINVSEPLIHFARVLDRYYIESRYPNGFPEGSPFEFFDEKLAEEALHAAGQILRFCDDRIGGP